MTTPNYSDAERELRRVEEIESAKMQDRTRAIVEAAERLLAAAAKLEARDRIATGVEIGEWDELRRGIRSVEEALALPVVPTSKLRALEAAALLYAQRAQKCRQRGEKDGPWCDEIEDALALPASPPVPESNLRAVYDAAERLVARNAEGGSLVEAWEAIEAAIALPAKPAPAWTSTPPTDHGWYFARWGGAPAGVVRVARGYDESDPTLCMWTIGEELCEPLSGVDVVEWWPVPIQPPEET